MTQAARTTDGSRFQLRQVGLIAAAHAAHDTYTAFLPPLLPLFVASLVLSKTEAGLLAVFLQAGWLLQPFIGHLADRSRTRLIVVLAPCASAVFMSLLGVAPGYVFLVLLLVLAGISSAAFHAVGPAMVSLLSGRAIGRGMGLWMVGGELGRTLGPVVAVTAVHCLTLERLPLMMIGGVGASVLLYLRLGSAPGHDQTGVERLPWRAVLRSLGPLMLPLAGIMLMRSFLVAALNLYLPIFLSEAGATLWSAGIALAILEGAGVLGALLGGAVSDHIGRRKTLAVSLLATPLFTFVFLATSGIAQFVLLVVLGLTGLSVTPVIMALVQESYPGNRALANGVYMVLNFAIRSLAILGLGILGDLAGLRLAYSISAAIALLGLPMLLWLPRAGTATKGG